MQPENQPQFAFLCDQEDELLSVVKELSSAQKKALAGYLVDYTKQQTLTEQNKQTEPTRQ